MITENNIITLVCVHSNDNLRDCLFYEAIESLCKQTVYENNKPNLFVVFDECSPSTINAYLQIVEKYNLPIFCCKKKNKTGLSDAKNLGINNILNSALKFKIKYIHFLDADDLILPDKLERQIAFLNNNPDIDILGTHALNRTIINISSTGFKSSKYYDSCHLNDKNLNSQEIIQSLNYENVLTHGSVIIKKEVLQHFIIQNGAVYDNSKKGVEDYDLWKRCAHDGFKFAQLPERLYVYTIGTSQAR